MPNWGVYESGFIARISKDWFAIFANLSWETEKDSRPPLKLTSIFTLTSDFISWPPWAKLLNHDYILPMILQVAKKGIGTGATGHWYDSNFALYPIYFIGNPVTHQNHTIWASQWYQLSQTTIYRCILLHIVVIVMFYLRYWLVDGAFLACSL